MGAAAATTGEEVIQVSANDIEENKVFDAESARQFTQSNVRTAVNSFSDPNVAADDSTPPPKYLSNEMLLRPLPVSKNEYLAGLIVNEQGCLVCTD